MASNGGKTMKPAFLFALLVVSAVLKPAIASDANSTFFSLGAGVSLEYRGTYEFGYKRVDFTQSGPDTYVVDSSQDGSPSKDMLVSGNGYTYWVLGGSGEEWLKVKDTFRTGDHWQHHLRGWNQTYRVVSSDLTVKVPAGTFRHCAKISISWIAREHDLEGPQEVDLYLAPGIGIVKRIVHSEGAVEHEEVATSYRKIAGKH